MFNILCSLASFHGTKIWSFLRARKKIATKVYFSCYQKICDKERLETARRMERFACVLAYQ